MKTVVLTGASGFVGRALTLYLKYQGVNVIPVSRQRRIDLYHVDNYLDCPEGDVLIHLAEEPDRSKVNRIGEKYQKESLELTTVLSKRFNGQVIYASSAVVYGDRNPFLNTENSPVEGVDLYSVVKLKNEQVVLANGGTVARISNLYGSGMSKNNVMSDILLQIPGAGIIKVRDSRPVRDFLFIDDLLTALSLMIIKSHNGILNVGSAEPVSILKLAELILEVANQKDRKVMSTQSRVGDSINTLDISKTSKVLGWRPSSTLKQHVSKLVLYGVSANG
ncbi:MAG: NAD(P)-dependent oxidoreductase [Colwellia sp.]|jgi:Nucleoside-diphosphate-sugar epimerases